MPLSSAYFLKARASDTWCDSGFSQNTGLSIFIRITSYNVCYTKLLRFSFILTDRAHNKGDAYHYWGFDGSTRGLCRAVEQEKSLPPDSVDGKQVFAWVKEGDPVVIKVLDSFCYNLAMRLFSLQAIYDPEIIAIGGGISADPLLMKYIQENILYLESHLPIHLIVPKVVRCHFMNDANLIGALRHHLKMQTAPIP